MTCKITFAYTHLLIGLIVAAYAASRDSGLLAAASELAAGASPNDQAAANTVAAIERALVWPLEMLAQQHRCHVLLYDTCELLLTTGLLDSGRLQMHMRQEVADCGGVLAPDCFTFYVMERCEGR
jgi:hypothetical protein